MVIQNSIKLLNEIADIETKIKRLESYVDANQIDFDKEELLKCVLKSYLE